MDLRSFGRSEGAKRLSAEDVGCYIAGLPLTCRKPSTMSHWVFHRDNNPAVFVQGWVDRICGFTFQFAYSNYSWLLARPNGCVKQKNAFLRITAEGSTAYRRLTTSGSLAQKDKARLRTARQRKIKDSKPTLAK